MDVIDSTFSFMTAESFKDQGHLDAIVSEAQEIVNDALKSFDSAYQQREAR